jgi:hypothetical protein
VVTHGGKVVTTASASAATHGSFNLAALAHSAPTTAWDPPPLPPPPPHALGVSLDPVAGMNSPVLQTHPKNPSSEGGPTGSHTPLGAAGPLTPVIPEPSSVVLVAMGAALAGCGVVRRRRKAA